MYGLPDFDNNQLLSQDVNYCCYDNGTYYIATDSGLTIYNGILYNQYNMSNTPFPSNDITFVTTHFTNCFESGNNNGLYVGTDKGIAIYQNYQWTAYDTTDIDIDNFYVTGILPNCYNDDETYVATRSGGLIKIYSDGEYDLFNTMSGNFEDDSLFYIKFMQLAGCGSFIVVGTSHHGIGYTSNWGPDYFQFDTQYEFSKAIAIGYYYGTNIIATDQSYMVLSPCGIVPNQIFRLN